MPKPNDELKELQKAYNRVFSGKDGDKILADLKKRTYYNATTYSPGCSAIDIAHREGRRSCLVHIINMMNMNVEHLEKLREKLNA